MKQTPHQRGFAAIAAIFLIVGLAALGSYMVSFSNAQQVTSAQDVQGSRAYWAARAGLEWSLASINASSACPAATPPTPIEGFSMAIVCTAQAYTEGVVSPTLFQIRSVASSGTVGSIGFIERSVSASIEK